MDATSWCGAADAAFGPLINILLPRINNKVPGYRERQRPESLPPHVSTVQASLALAGPYKQPRTLPKPGRGHISSPTSPLPPHAVSEIPLSFRCRFRRGACCQLRPTTTSPSLSPPTPRLRVTGCTSNFPHRPRSPIPGAEAILSPYAPQAIFIQPFIPTAGLGRGRAEQQPGFLPDGRRQAGVFPRSPGHHQHRPSHHHAVPRDPLTLLAPFSFPVYLSRTTAHSQMRKYGTMLPQEKPTCAFSHWYNVEVDYH